MESQDAAAVVAACVEQRPMVRAAAPFAAARPKAERLALQPAWAQGAEAAECVSGVEAEVEAEQHVSALHPRKCTLVFRFPPEHVRQLFDGLLERVAQQAALLRRAGLSTFLPTHLD